MTSTETTTPRQKRRLLLPACAALIASALIAFGAAVAYARFSKPTTSATNTLAAGNVTLTTTAGGTCTASNLLPGASPSGCTLQATYSGSVSAYLAIDVLIATKSGSPGTIALYNPLDATKDLQITVTDNQGTPVHYVTSTTNFGAALASCPGGSGFDSSYTCYRLTNLLVSTTPFTNASAADTFTTSVSLPSNNPTGYQGGTASIVVTVHAAQSSHQTLGTCTAGNGCASITWV